MSDFVHPLMSHLLVGANGAGDVVLKNVGESDFVSPFWSWFIICAKAATPPYARNIYPTF